MATDDSYDDGVDDEVVGDGKAVERKKQQHYSHRDRVELVVLEGSCTLKKVVVVLVVLAWNNEGGAQQRDLATWPELDGCADPRTL